MTIASRERAFDLGSALLRALALVIALTGCCLASCSRGVGAIDRARLLAPSSAEWLTTGRDFGKTHFSPLTDINTSTVARLGFAWAYDTGTDRGLEATPIVVDGVMFTSGVAGRVYALDAASGKLLWKYEPTIDMQIARSVCCDNVNRGVAVWGGRVYVGALDGWLYALDARSGAVVWKVDTVVDRTRGYSSTGAPEVAGDVVVIGNAGGDMDARGYITAYDLRSGKQAWRFFIVPGSTGQAVRKPRDGHGRKDLGRTRRPGHRRRRRGVGRDGL